MKCVFGAGFYGAARERRSAMIAERSSPWRYLNLLPCRPLLVLPGMSLIASRHLQGHVLRSQDTVELAHRILNLVNHMQERIHWSATLDHRFRRSVWKALPQDTRSTVNQLLRNLTLVKTGAHGDLHFTNVLRTSQGDFWIIDWERYRKSGSCIEDVARLLGTRNRKSPDPGNDILDIYESGVFSSVDGRLGITTVMWLTIYVISQSTCELQSRGAPEVVHRTRIRVARLMSICQSEHRVRSELMLRCSASA